MTRFKKVLLVVAVAGFFFCGCCMPGNYYVEIKQEVDTNSVLKNTYDVETRVWIRDWTGFPETLERSYHNYHVSCNDVPRIKARQLKEAKAVKERCLIALKDFEKCKWAD